MTVKKVAQLLTEKDNFEILTHRYPDGDCLGSAYALAMALQSMGKNVRVIATDVPKSLQFLAQGILPQDFSPEYIVSVDVAGPDLLGEYKEKYQNKIDLCIDHHRLNTVEAKEKYVDSQSAAAGEIIYEVIKEMGAEIIPQIASALYTAISTDTGCFGYTNTTARTLRICADLIELGCEKDKINKELFQTKSKNRLELERQIYENIIYCCQDKCAIIYVTEEMESAVAKEDVEGLASIPREIEGVKMGITIREKPNGIYKVSVRTQGDIDACEFCRQFGGGGHIAASGCTLQGDLQSTIDTLIEAAERTI